MISGRTPGTALDYAMGEGRNSIYEMLKMFDALKIIRYEIVQAKADFYERQQVDVLRMVATKP